MKKFGINLACTIYKGSSYLRNYAPLEVGTGIEEFDNLFYYFYTTDFHEYSSYRMYTTTKYGIMSKHRLKSNEDRDFFNSCATNFNVVLEFGEDSTLETIKEEMAEFQSKEMRLDKNETIFDHMSFFGLAVMDDKVELFNEKFKEMKTGAKTPFSYIYSLWNKDFSSYFLNGKILLEDEIEEIKVELEKKQKYFNENIFEGNPFRIESSIGGHFDLL